MDVGLLGRVGSLSSAVYIPIGIRHHHERPPQSRPRASPALTPSMSSPIPRLTDWHGAAQLHPYFVCDVFTSEPLQGNQPAPPGSSPRASSGSPNSEPQAARPAAYTDRYVYYGS